MTQYIRGSQYRSGRPGGRPRYHLHIWSSKLSFKSVDRGHFVTRKNDFESEFLGRKVHYQFTSFINILFETSRLTIQPTFALSYYIRLIRKKGFFLCFLTSGLRRNIRFKLNMKPMNLQVTNKFYKKIRQFFFPDMQHDGTIQSTAHPAGSVTGKNSGTLSGESLASSPDSEIHGPIKWYKFVNIIKTIHFLIPRVRIQLDRNS